MTVKECYEELGGNYEDVLGRMMKDERICKFTGMFLKDTSYTDIIQQMAAGDYDAAFRAAHTLKGVCQNMSFTALYEVDHEVTEALRRRDIKTAEELLPELTVRYEKTINAIRQLLAE